MDIIFGVIPVLAAAIIASMYAIVAQAFVVMPRQEVSWWMRTGYGSVTGLLLVSHCGHQFFSVSGQPMYVPVLGALGCALLFLLAEGARAWTASFVLGALKASSFEDHHASLYAGVKLR